jgi:DNA mismatch endonuclease (patch repair protein)
MAARTRPWSYRGLRATNRAASRWGKANRAHVSGPELLLRRAIWRLGLRYRLHDDRLPGAPDIVLKRHRAVVFVDGDFWHGRHWRKRRVRLAAGANANYWIAKIERNRTRDRSISRALMRLGWKVIRVWESDVQSDPDRIAREIATGILPRASHE